MRFSLCRHLRRVETAEAQLQLGIPSDAFVFCYVGRLNSEKGISELIQAFQELTGNVYLVLAGGLDESSPLHAKDMKFD